MRRSIVRQIETKWRSRKKERFQPAVVVGRTLIPKACCFNCLYFDRCKDKKKVYCIEDDIDCEECPVFKEGCSKYRFSRKMRSINSHLIDDKKMEV